LHFFTALAVINSTFTIKKGFLPYICCHSSKKTPNALFFYKNYLFLPL